MTACIFHGEREVWGSNGQIEHIVQALIKFAPEDSRLLRWSVECYRMFYTGICIDLAEAVETDAEIADWKRAIAQALDHVRPEWSDRGREWINEHRPALVDLADPQPTEGVWLTVAGLRVGVVNEAGYSFGSTDNRRSYAVERRGDSAHVGTVRGVLVEAEGALVLGSDGINGLDRQVVLPCGAFLLLGVGRHVAAIDVRTRHLAWMIEVDFASCFGLHHEPTRDAIIVHGEVEVSRIDTKGTLLWRASGADIFSGSLRLEADHIAVTDFNGRAYRLDYATGAELG